MNKYPLYESRMKSYGLEDITIEDMIAQGMITEERIAEIEKELLQEYEKDGTYDLEKSPYFDIVIHYTCDYLKRAKERLSHDLGLLLEESGSDTPRTDKTEDIKTESGKANNPPETPSRTENPKKFTLSPAVRLFLLEQQNKLNAATLT